MKTSTATIPQRFIASFSFDQRLAPHDIAGSIAHTRMLARRRIIPSADARRIITGLTAIQAGLARGAALRPAEDIHFAIEQELIRRIGPVGGKMHTARSRNDQVALDLRLYLRAAIDSLSEGIVECQKTLCGCASRNRGALMPGYTHLQHAQPILFAHHLLAYAWMLQRDRERLADCRRRVNVLPLGSAALAGTSFPIDRAWTARELGFDAVSDNSIDSVSERDCAIEYLSALAMTAMHLSRLAEELILWSSAEFGFVRIADEFTSGSSIMPQKRNPDVAELVRGKTGRAYGALVTLLTICKGLPLAYNRDLQEDKPPVFDATDALEDMLSVSSGMIRSLRVDSDRMRAELGRGFPAATELADFLARAGIPFRTAHGIVRRIVAHCQRRGRTLESLTTAELRGFSPAFTAKTRQILSPEAIVRAKTSAGSTSPASIARQLARLGILTRTKGKGH